jgi:hypothetical protein
MWDLDLYARLDLADAWIFVAPVNWYGPPSNLKLMFDRLVCMNGGNPSEDLIEHKDPELAMKLEGTPLWKELSKNHLEGRTAAFFSYGDGGGDEMRENGRPKLLEHAHYFEPEREPFADERDSLAPIVWQCRFSGVEVPEDLWRYVCFGQGRRYADNQAEHMDQSVLAAVNAFAECVSRFVAQKGKVRPGRHRAFGYDPPKHAWADTKLGLRWIEMQAGRPPQDSSPAAQQALGLNRDIGALAPLPEGDKRRQPVRALSSRLLAKHGTTAAAATALIAGAYLLGRRARR